jgi:hypothetical protein
MKRRIGQTMLVSVLTILGQQDFTPIIQQLRAADIKVLYVTGISSGLGKSLGFHNAQAMPEAACAFLCTRFVFRGTIPKEQTVWHFLAPAEGQILLRQRVLPPKRLQCWPDQFFFSFRLSRFFDFLDSGEIGAYFRPDGNNVLQNL